MCEIANIYIPKEKKEGKKEMKKNKAIFAPSSPTSTSVPVPMNQPNSIAFPERTYSLGRPIRRRISYGLNDCDDVTSI
jgi:hypothetical protein